MESIIVALITGGLALVGVVITNMSANKQIENNLKVAQAVTDTKIENLTNEVRRHNDFVTRVPLIEDRVERIEKKLERMDNDK